MQRMSALAAAAMVVRLENRDEFRGIQDILKGMAEKGYATMAQNQAVSSFEV